MRIAPDSVWIRCIKTLSPLQNATYFYLFPSFVFFLDVFLSNRGLLSHIAHSSRPLSAASTASSSFAPSQWQSGPVALMNAVINSRTHSLFRPLKLLLSASNSTTRHLCCYSICAPRQACACECQPMCVCVFVCTGRGGPGEPSLVITICSTPLHSNPSRSLHPHKTVDLPCPP